MIEIAFLLSTYLPLAVHSYWIIIFKSLPVISQAISVWNNCDFRALGAVIRGAVETQVSLFYLMGI